MICQLARKTHLVRSGGSFRKACAMSTRWNFHSFAGPRWDAVFGGGLPGAEDHVIQSVTWDRTIWKDEQVPIGLAQTIVRNGISYDGLSAQEADLLDAIIVGFFCPEGLEDLLGLEYESPDGLSMAVVEALVERAAEASREASPSSRSFDHKRPAGPQLLDYLLVGRRHNGAGAEISEDRLARALQRVADTTDRVAVERQVRIRLAATPSPGRRYLILDSEEVSRCHDQVAWAIARPLPWPGPGYEATARQCLLEVLASARKKWRWLAGRYT
jgi:hypothetical protein